MAVAADNGKSSGQPRQLLLDIKVDEQATFENYCFSEDNQELAGYLNEPPKAAEPASNQYSYLWGAEGVGRTHLLQALCNQSDTRHLSSVYIPLKSHRELDPMLLEGLESLDVVCLDDLQAVAGMADWETALFSLYNRLKDSGTRLFVSANVSPRLLKIQLPDLLSRLQSGLVFQVLPLDDDEKRRALQLRASRRGFTLSDEVASYILLRNDRGMRSLFDVLQRLDRHSLEQKRRITVPLVRELMNW